MRIKNYDSKKIQLILSMTIFGTIGLIRRYIPYSSALVAFIRGIVGVLFLLFLHFIRKETFDKKGVLANKWKLLISGALIGANWILLFEAYCYTSVSVATICYYMAPVFVTLASPLIIKEKLTVKKGVCVLIAVIGMVLVSGVLETGFSGIVGVLYGLGAALLYACVILINKKIVGMQSNDRTVFQLASASIVLLPYALLTENIAAVEWKLFPILMLLLAGILHTGIAYALYFDSLPHISAQTVAIFSYIDPVVAVILSATVLGEGISLLAIIGTVLVLGAAFFSEK